MTSKKTVKPPDNSWTRWVGLGAQFAGAIGFGLWLGNWLDGRMSKSTPLFIWLLPLLLIAVLLYQLIKATAKRNDGEKTDDL
ncbi:MAG: AtpZ/AtpI family protein [Bacteroidetes bacterium]|nr:AtpZ/AtpI family protein [Bacteroidota bacterium]